MPIVKMRNNGQRETWLLCIDFRPFSFSRNDEHDRNSISTLDNSNVTVRAASDDVKARREDLSKANNESRPGKELFSGFIKLHVLHHAAEGPVYGLWLIEELAEHGYRVSPGTLYPLLHSMEEAELLESYSELFDGKIRRYYTSTSHGRRHLKKAKNQLIELLAEILTKREFEGLCASRRRSGEVGESPARSSKRRH